MRLLRLLVVLLGAVGTAQHAAGAPRSSAQAVPEVYVVLRAAPPGTVLTEADVARVPLDPRAAEGALSTDVIGRTVHEVMFPGEPVREARLLPLDPRRFGSGLQALVPIGERLDLLRVPAASTLGIEPGSWVQLLFLAGEGVRAPDSMHQVHFVDHAGVIGILRPPMAIALTVDEQAIPVLRAPGDATEVHEHGPKVGEARAGTGSVVAIRALAPGVSITEADVAALPIAIDGAPPLDQILGKRPRAPILPGEVVRTLRLADATKGIGMDALIPRQMVMLGVPAPPGDAIQPGSYVDVFGPRAIQAAFVMAREEGQVSLLLTSTDAATLASWPATWTGDLRFAIRNDLDAQALDLQSDAPPKKRPR